MNILDVSNLTKQYKDFKALKGISFSVGQNEILGFLGPNGAGKTTTIQILLQIITPNGGEVKLFGMDAFKNREESLQRMNFTSAYSDHTLHVTAESEDILGILGKLYANGYKIRDIDIDEPDLEDVFLKIAREGV